MEQENQLCREPTREASMNKIFGKLVGCLSMNNWPRVWNKINQSRKLIRQNAYVSKAYKGAKPKCMQPKQ